MSSIEIIETGVVVHTIGVPERLVQEIVSFLESKGYQVKVKTGK